jgi:flagellar hook-basal body complex protein FliE
MPSPIQGLGIPTPPLPPAAAGAGPGGGVSGNGSQFADMLLKSLNQVSGLEAEAHAAVEKGFTGDDITQVEALTSMKKADLALRLMIQIRNKIMDAYSEIKQMQM